MTRGIRKHSCWTGPIVRGTPYWLKEPDVVSDKDLSFQGIAPTQDFVFSLPARASDPFGVMFGTPFPQPISADSVLFRNTAKRGDVWLNWADAYSEPDPSLRIAESSAVYWDAAMQGFLYATPSQWAGNTHQLDPWLGYWILIYGQNEMRIKLQKP